MLEFFFWFSLVLLVYPYAIYPMIAWCLSRILARPVRKGGIEPTVTVVTAAFNESAVIGHNIANKLAQEYPADKLQMIVVSDASADGTDEVVRQIAASDPRVRLLRQEPRAGKTAAINRAIAASTSEIIVFADANSIFGADAIRELLRNFSDPSVGYVTGKMIYTSADGTVAGDGSSAFMKYENALRAVETRLGSIVGADGGIDAVRRSLYRPMRPDQLPDFVLPLDVVRQGYRAVFEPAAVLREHALSDSKSEFRMRVRVSLRALWALWDMKVLLLPWAAGLFSWQLWSHKVLRYLSFIPLLACALLLGILAQSQPFFRGLAFAGAAFILAAVVARDTDRLGRLGGVARLAYYFLLINSACAVAFWKFIRRQKQVTWQPRVG